MSSNPPDIIRNFERVPAHIVAQAAQFQPAILADVAGRRGAMHGRIKALRPRMKLAGPAFTVEVRPGDNLMIHAAIAMARPGDVLVIDGKGDQGSALMGTIMMTACQKLGIAGVVMDGACRDSLEIDEMNYPVFCVGTNPNGPTKNIAGRIGHPVSVGNVTVRAGDFVIADGDGVVVVEREKIEALLPAAARKVSDEAARIAAIKEGDTAAKWLNGALRTAGVLKEGEVL
ncbi:regulator of RNase E activity RraA [Variovorax paradoxus]|uniref:Putative 4-hydroxy-4-methyl-2-oxoglutarate aldolase n=1 Tax=Variovorax paradoxus TaxID=34073 RepID=A0AAE4BZE9_VARPD|nr:RraA family protein [Variovorax paradoxus]MDP9964461.1 regulator of RNase E activity RraA [Variovorax paradoxus]MDR6427400.1 regulator of RNase E activity RraA [Variovorax paradoxus]MDR6454562.1 regulator of RNase E activity RraA [Variovorax paradoxus]